MFPGFLTPVLTQLFFPKPPTTFLTCFCRGEMRKYTGRKVASTGDRTHNHQVMSPTCSPLSHPGGAKYTGYNQMTKSWKAFADDILNVAEVMFSVYRKHCGKRRKCNQHFLLFLQCFQKDRKHCGKRRKSWLPAFSPFCTMFSKGLFYGIIKIELCGKALIEQKTLWEKEKIQIKSTFSFSKNIFKAFLQKGTKTCH